MAVRSIAWFCGEPQTYCKTNGKRRITNMSGDWIPVTERLPEEGQRVLAYEKPELIVVAEMHSRSVSGGLWWSTDNGHTAYSVFPTHWMPLPAPPQADK